MNPLKSKIGAADNQDPAHNKYIRNLRSTDQLMKQFCRYESSVDKPAYDRGWVWNFEWCSEDPLKALPAAVSATNAVMSRGYSFEEAFDTVVKLQDECTHPANALSVADRRCLFCGESFYDCGHEW